MLVADVDAQPVEVLALSLTPRFAEGGMFSRITALGYRDQHVRHVLAD